MIDEKLPTQSELDHVCHDSREEKEMVVKFIIDAIEKLKEGTTEEQVEARNFLFYKDNKGFNAFSFWIDHIFGFNYDVDPEVAISAIKRQLKECKKNGKNKSNDGRRKQTAPPCNNDKYTRDNDRLEESAWIEIIFG